MCLSLQKHTHSNIYEWNQKKISFTNNTHTHTYIKRSVKKNTKGKCYKRFMLVYTPTQHIFELSLNHIISILFLFINGQKHNKI